MYILDLTDINYQKSPHEGFDIKTFISGETRLAVNYNTSVLLVASITNNFYFNRLPCIWNALPVIILILM